ncbi:hypothetical protein [Sphingomonas sp.]|uniref:hypothetical protein n=1 Tax=Sphingomonas sp. TaxID=28214 RepID=UPI0031DA8941
MQNLAATIREQIEELDARLASLDSDAKPIREQLGNIDRTRSKLSQQRTELREKLKEMEAKPRVSDHAVIRYLERKHGFDFERVRDELLTPTVITAMNLGAEGVKINGGTLKLRGRTVTTYVDGQP